MNLKDQPCKVFRKKTFISGRKDLNNYKRLTEDSKKVEVFEGTYFDCLKFKHERMNFEKNQGHNYVIVKL